MQHVPVGIDNAISIHTRSGLLSICDSAGHRFLLHRLEKGRAYFIQQLKLQPSYTFRKRSRYPFRISPCGKYIAAAEHDLAIKLWKKTGDSYIPMQIVQDKKSRSVGLPIGVITDLRFIPGTTPMLVSFHSMDIGVPGYRRTKDFLNIWTLKEKKFEKKDQLEFSGLPVFQHKDKHDESITIRSGTRYYRLKRSGDRCALLQTRYHSINSRKLLKNRDLFFPGVPKPWSQYWRIGSRDFFIGTTEKGRIVMHLKDVRKKKYMSIRISTGTGARLLATSPSPSGGYLYFIYRQEGKLLLASCPTGTSCKDDPLRKVKD